MSLSLQRFAELLKLCNLFFPGFRIEIMALLEDKLINGDVAGYCSSSDEDDNSVNSKLTIIKDEDVQESKVMKRIRNTGPKGVIEDWRIFRDEQKKFEKLKQQKVY